MGKEKLRAYLFSVEILETKAADSRPINQSVCRQLSTLPEVGATDVTDDTEGGAGWVTATGRGQTNIDEIKILEKGMDVLFG